MPLSKEQLRRIAKWARATFYTSKAKRRLLEARRNLDKPTSALFFTTHKCASTFISDALFPHALKGSKLEFVDYSKAIWAGGNGLYPGGVYEDFLSKAYSDLYSERGNVYGPLRMYLNFPGRDNFRHVFFLRDPRDVLVSSYYSEAFTHPMPASREIQRTIKENRTLALTQSTDQYVITRADSWICPLYEGYIDLRRTAKESFYLKYDLYVANTRQFIEELCSFLGVEPSAATIDLLVERSPVQAKEEMKHKRSGKPGQYKKKLSPETITRLNNKLSTILDYWDFQ